MKSFVHLFKGGRFQRQRLWLPCAQGEIPFLHKAQEGRRNSPVDCFGVGNPRRGFPESRRQRDFVLIFSPVYVIQEMSRYRSCKEKIFYTTSAKPISALKRKDYRTLPTRFGVPAAPRFGARRPAPGICNSRNEPIPALHSKDNRTLPTRFAARRPAPGICNSRNEPIPAYKSKDDHTLPTRFAARRPAPGICNSRNEPIPALHSKDNRTLPTRFAARRPVLSFFRWSES